MVLKPNFENIPQELIKHDHWILWKAEKLQGQEKLTKIPYQVNGYKAASNKPETWSSFSAVKAVYEKGSYDGIGFMFSSKARIIGIDIDNLDMAEIESDGRTKNLIQRTYCEQSPSGAGLHAYVIGEVPTDREPGFNNSEKGVEAYADYRYFTVTGQTVNNLPVKQDQELINAVYKKYGERFYKKSIVKDIKVSEIEYDDRLTTEDVWDRINSIKDKDKRESIKALYEGLSNEYESQSNADYALANYLLYYSDLNYPLVYEMMCESYSGQRDKWYSPRRFILEPSTYSSYGYNTVMKLVAEYIKGDKATFSNYELKKIEDEFTVIVEENEAPTDYDTEWLKELETAPKSSVPLPSRRNIKLILENDPLINDTFRKNEFSGQKEVKGMPYWRRGKSNSLLWTDVDDAAIRNHIGTVYGIESDKKITDLIMVMFEDKSYHPIKDYLEGLEWDGQGRLDTFFIDYLGAADEPYVRRVTELSLVGAVARIYEPGIKFDTMFVLYGRQGQGKSYILKRLGREWFNDSPIKIHDKDGFLALQGSWIIEMSELASMAKREVTEVKQYLSSQIDNYRAPYARYSTQHPRQCVFFGTTNNIDFLKDKTGNRRFYPVSVDTERAAYNPFTDLTEEVIDQVWAEALAMYRLGVNIMLDNRTESDIIQRAEAIQKEHTEDDGLAAQIIEYLDTPKNDFSVIGKEDDEQEEEYHDRICWQIVWYEMLGQKGIPPTHEKRRINDALRSISFLEEKNNIRLGKYGHTRGFMVRR